MDAECKRSAPEHDSYTATDKTVTTAIVTANLSELVKLLDSGHSFKNESCRISYDGVEYAVSPLFLAAKLGHYELIPPLLSHGANPALIEMRGDSALSLVLKKKVVAVAAVMLESNFDFSRALVHKNSDNELPLDLIVTDVKLKQLLPCIAAKGIRFDHVDDSTILNIEMVIVEAIEDEAIETIQSVVGLGWDVNRNMFIDKDINGSALYYACYCGNYNSVVCLVQLGSDVNCKAADGSFAVECCLLQSSSAYEKIACYLVDYGFKINIMLSRTGCTLLHYACRKEVGYTHLAVKCIEKSADPMIPCSEGSLVLCNLIQEGNHAIISLLVAAQKERFGALSKEFANFIDSKQTANNHWPLLLAVSNNDHAIVSLLLGNCANPNLVCDDGRSCLHVAALSGDIISCKLLVGAGADLSLRSSDPLPTALDFAINQNHTDVAVFLVLSGADVESKINSNAQAPTSIDLAPGFMKQKIMDALSAFETFSSLRKMRMMKQVDGSGSEFQSIDSTKKSVEANDSLPATPEEKLTKTYGFRSVGRSSPNSGKFVLTVEDATALLADEKSAQSFSSLEGSLHAVDGLETPRMESELSASKLKLWSERWGSEAAITHADVINFLTARSASAGPLESDSKPSTPRPLCIICRKQRMNCTLTHAGASGSGHICVCFQCGVELKESGGNCPLCGETIVSATENPVLKDTLHGKFYVNKNFVLPAIADGDNLRRRVSRQLQNVDEVLTGRHSIDDRPDTAEMFGDIAVITPRFESPDQLSMNKQDSAGSLFDFCQSDPMLLSKVLASRRGSNVDNVPKLQIRPASSEREKASSSPDVSPKFSNTQHFFRGNELSKSNLITMATPLVPVLDMSDIVKNTLVKSSSGSKIVQNPARSQNGDVDTVQIRCIRSPGMYQRQSSSSATRIGSPTILSPIDSPLSRPRSRTELEPNSKSFTKVKTYSDVEIVPSLTTILSTPGTEQGVSGLFSADDDEDLEIIDISSPRLAQGKEAMPEVLKKKKKSKKKKKDMNMQGKSGNRLADALSVSIDEVQKRSRSNSGDVIISGRAVPAMDEDSSLMPIPSCVGNLDDVDNDIDNDADTTEAPTYDERIQDDMTLGACCVDTFVGCFVIFLVLIVYSIYSVFSPIYKTLNVLFIVMVACNNGGSESNNGSEEEVCSGFSIGGFICSIFTFIFGGIVYVLAAFFYVFAISPLAVLAALQPLNFADKYEKFRFIDLRNPLKPTDKDEFANFDEINLEKDLELQMELEEYD